MEKDMRSRLLTFLCVLLVTITTIAWRSQAKSDGSVQLLTLEAEFQKTTTEKGLDGFMSYFAEDAADLPNGGPIVTGKENIRQALGPWGPDVSLTWTPVKAEMAASGDLGYAYGTFVFKANDKDGNPVTHYGKYTTIWEKQKDGTWKVALDMGNSGPSPSSKP